MIFKNINGKYVEASLKNTNSAQQLSHNEVNDFYRYIINIIIIIIIIIIVYQII